MTARDPMISTHELARRLGEPALVIIDASWFLPGSDKDPAKDYAARHIPGAVFFDIDATSDAVSGLPHMAASPAEFATAARRHGVDPNSLVVIYDSAGVFSAPRVWWNFRMMGHDRVFVLDGGFPKWIAEDHPIEMGWREPAHGRGQRDAVILEGRSIVSHACDDDLEQLQVLSPQVGCFVVADRHS